MPFIPRDFIEPLEAMERNVNSCRMASMSDLEPLVPASQQPFAPRQCLQPYDRSEDKAWARWNMAGAALLVALVAAVALVAWGW